MSKLKLTSQQSKNFWAKVIKAPGCWLWAGHVCPRNVAKFHLTRNITVASRVSFMIHKGMIPLGMEVCHSCDNGRCVNPDHLWLGTHGDNMRDMESKGRGNQQKGEKCGKSKLTNQKVIEIRRLYHSGLSYRKIAPLFQMDFTSIADIVTRKTWSHI